MDAAAATNGTSSTPASPTAMVSVQPEFFVALCAPNGSVTGITSGNPFIDVGTPDAAGIAYYISSAAGSFYAEWNQSADTTFVTDIVSFK